MRGQAPGYICSLILIDNVFTYGLLSNSKLLLVPPSTKTKKTLGARAFTAAELVSRAPTVVGTLVFHQCGPGPIFSPGVICGLSWLMLYSVLRSFSPGPPVFPSAQKPKI